MLSKQEIAGLRELLAKATSGEWMLATSCSWRRILTTDGKPVIVPTIQRSDNHPDMECGDEYVNAELAIAAVNALPALLDIAEAVDGQCEWKLHDCKRETTYEAACGELWSFNDGGPEDNHVKFCHGCGKPVAVLPLAGEVAK